MTPEQLFLSELPRLERAIQRACRNSHLRQEETEDFASHVRLKLIENDYAVFRKFQGKCTLTTYLNTVVLNLLRDYQNHRWGKWRPCAAAVHLGKVAIKLDQLLSRDGRSLDEAIEILRTNHHVQETPQQLREMAAKFPPRTSRHVEGQDSLPDLPDQSEPADRLIREAEQDANRQRIYEALEEAMATLPPEDAIIIKMRAEFSIVEIARVLGLEQKSKSLYGRIDRILRTLRKELERRGVHSDDISDLLDG
jgi:RNA polymerase sigma factor (sigma-70 family)